MMKTRKQNIESFRMIYLKISYKINNASLGIYVSFLIMFLTSSCSIQNEVNKDDYRQISKTFSAKFYDKLDTINAQYDTRHFTRSLIKEFINKENVDYVIPIEIQINHDKLYIKFSDKDKKSYVLKYFGKCTNRKFVFYTNYKTITFPFLFMSKEMSKYSVYLSDENEIIFESYDVSEGMMLLFGAGNSSKKDYKFKIIKNE